MQASVFTNHDHTCVNLFRACVTQRTCSKCHVVSSDGGPEVIAISQAFASRIIFEPYLSSSVAIRQKLEAVPASNE
jgi:hypothetical protein